MDKITDAHKYKKPRSLDAFSRNDCIALDFETISLTDKTPTLFSLAAADGGGKYKAAAFKPDMIPNLLNLIRGKQVVFHNFTFDAQVILGQGGDIFSFDAHDTKVAAHLLEEGGTHKLKERAECDIGFRMTEWVNVDKSDASAYKKYAADDAYATIALFYPYYAQLKKQSLLTAYELERKVLHPVTYIEHNGINLDIDKLNGLEKICIDEMEAVEDKIYRHAKRIFSLSASRALAEYIYDDLKIHLKDSYVTEKTGLRSAASNIIEDILSDLPKKDKRREYIASIVNWKRLQKLKTSFFPPLKKSYSDFGDGKIHPNLNSTGTATGRFSMSNPNLQQLPASPIFMDKDNDGNYTRMDTHIRSTFVAGEGRKFIAADYSQIELRILAHMSGDRNMIQEYYDGVDNHQLMADKANAMGANITRSQAKIPNFGKVYGMGEYGFSKTAKIPLKDAEIYFEEYEKHYPRVSQLREEIICSVLDRGYVRTITGRKRRNSNGDTNEKSIARSFMSGMIQGGAAMVVKAGMIKSFDRYKNKDVKMILNVHDEILYDVPEEIAEEVAKAVKYDLENAVELSVPLVVEPKIINNFAEGK